MQAKKRYKLELLKIIGLVSKDAGLLNAFFVDLLTPKEWEEISVRWQIIKLLATKIPQRRIAKELQVSITKITRGSRELLDKNGGFAKVLKLLKKPQ